MNNKSLPFVILCVCSLILMGSFAFFWQSSQVLQIDKNNNYHSSNQKDSFANLASSNFSSVKPIPTALRLNTMFFGNTFWGRYIDDWAKASELKYVYPFSGLNTLEREKYDAWISGIECPITDTYRTSLEQDLDLKFSCPIEYTTEAAKWIDAFTLANNHTDNMEEVNGLQQTRQNLDKNGIQYFGHFDNAQTKDVCEIVSFSAQIKFAPDENFKKTENNEQNYFVPLALCGYHNVFKLPTEEELTVISDYSKYLPTIVMPHGGAEYESKADQLKVSYYRQMIDKGADAVIGDHPHVVQNTEVYQDKLIVYSMGNFIFDQQGNQSLRQSLAVNLDFEFINDLNMQKWTEFGQGCKKFKDDCLQKAQQFQLQKPKFKIKYSATATDSTGKLTKKASPQIEVNVLQIANWSNTLAKLEQQN